MKKIFVKSLLLVATVLIMKNSTITCYACATNAGISSAHDGKAIILSEETVWKYRYHNGKRQKRLWSCSNNCWISDHWIDM
ncbi:hypothetical protein SAMN02910275_00485 [Butyrivibrio sp. INlla18]|uniref:Uncharacterized protein n=2 Tax=Lachnospiraceae TaxID=186803 RepID=A0A1D9P4J1_9FIRM|nr:hypothetical protein bhn_I2494 [Butyrivibrio hungatei]SDA43964.1 hypothetical protein SAMN02910275_00485 [Butyrivibrio sp. INlla18]